MQPLCITRTATLENLPALLETAEQACVQLGASAAERDEVRLVIEEASVNIITHGYGGTGAPGPITLALGWDPPRLTIEIADRAPLFDPASLAPPALDAPWDERQVGGLGWHLVRQMVDEMHYRPDPDGGNHLTLVKQIHPIQAT